MSVELEEADRSVVEYRGKEEELQQIYAETERGEAEKVRTHAREHKHTVKRLPLCKAEKHLTLSRSISLSRSLSPPPSLPL